MGKESDHTFEQVATTRRQAAPEDTDLARAMHHAAYKDVVEQQFGTFEEVVQDVFFAKSWKPETHEFILVNGEIVGYCSVEHHSHEIFVHELVLSPEHQGKGIGSNVLKDVLEEATQKELPVRLQVLKANKARELYQKLGFREYEETDTHFKMEYIPDESKKS
jgi:ribosomal protein S18 acetylase RimI-like enzyme